MVGSAGRIDWLKILGLMMVDGWRGLLCCVGKCRETAPCERVAARDAGNLTVISRSTSIDGL